MILLTGGTGGLGREVLKQTLASDEAARMILLVRPSREQSAESRVREILSEAQRARCEVVVGDVTLERFGLGESEFTSLASRTSQIIHCAASTHLGQSLADARVSNVNGTAQVIALANESKRVREQAASLLHVSTAYVVGDTDTIVSPDLLQLDAPFRNAYEQSKAEAEALVRAARVPFTIVRPSIIVGHSVTGVTSAFNVIYIPARFLAEGLFSILPGAPFTPFDLVPIDYVARAITALVQAPDCSGRSYHLCSGVGRETTVREILEFIVKTVNTYRRKGLALLHTPPIISPELLLRACQSFSSARHNLERLFVKKLSVWVQTRPFIPYMLRNPRFDISGNESFLHSGCLHPPPLFTEYAERVFKYCLDTNWGRVYRLVGHDPEVAPEHAIAEAAVR